MTKPMGYDETSDIQPPYGDGWYIAESNVSTTIVDHGWVPRLASVICIIWSRVIPEEDDA